MRYVISDLHGCYDKFMKLLKLINFSETDELYILGDIFDRGPEPLKILDYVIEHRNVILIKENHEKMFEEYFESGDSMLWYFNGGQVTHNQIIDLGYIKGEQIYKCIKRLPVIKAVDKFILVHAGIFLPDNYRDLNLEELIKLQDEDVCIWDRSRIGYEKQFKDYTVICGHTPVQSIINNSDDVKILKRKGTYYIDCGCCFTKANGKLACLRLDDLKEFYIS